MLRYIRFDIEPEKVSINRGVRYSTESEKWNVMFFVNSVDRIIAQCRDKSDAELVRDALEFAHKHNTI